MLGTTVLRVTGIPLLPTLTSLLLFTGCTFVPCDLHDKQRGFLCVLAAHRVPQNRDDRGQLTGSVQVEAPFAALIVVFVYRTREGRAEIVDSQVLQPHGPYSFVFTVPPGIYRLAAFEDEAQDLRYDPSHDRAVLYHDGGPIVLMRRQTVDRLYLRPRNDRPQRIDFEVALAGDGGERCCQSPHVSVRGDEGF